MTNRFTGTFTALLTPFRDGAVDYASLRRLVDAQIQAGVSGLVPTGTTGESPTLSPDEHIEVIRVTVEAAGGRVPVIAGTGANATTEAIEYTQRAEDVGANGFLHVAPYYNKPSQAGLYHHFASIARCTEKPIILYSVPGRTGVEIGVETIRRLAHDFPHVNAVKEAGGNCDRVSQILIDAPDGFTVLSGDDSLTLPFISVGAQGVISVASNVFPSETSQMVEAALRNDFLSARAIHQRLFPLFRDFLALASNPVPVKYAAARLGLIDSGELRLPLWELSEAGQRQIDDSLRALNLIS